MGDLAIDARDRRRLDAIKTLVVILCAIGGPIGVGYVVWAKISGAASADDLRRTDADVERNTAAIAEIRAALASQTAQAQLLLVQQAEMRADVRGVTSSVQRIERAIEGLTARPR